MTSATLFIRTIDAKTHRSLISIESSLGYETPEARRELLTKFLIEFPQFVPTRSGETEPLRWVYDERNADTFAAKWKTSLIWRGAKPRSLGMVYTARYPYTPGNFKHTSFFFDAKLKSSGEQEFVRLANYLSSEMEIDFGLVHHLNAPDLARSSAGTLLFLLDPEKNRWSLTLTSHQLRFGLPDVFWKTYFGPPYVEMIGEDLLMSAPAFEVSRPGQGIIAIQLTSSLDDCIHQPQAVEDARNRLIDHLGNEFFNPTCDKSHPARVPNFRFPAQ